MTKVLSVQHYPVFGGPHNEIIKLEPELNRRGISTVVAHTDQAGNAAERLRDVVDLRLLSLERLHLTTNPASHLRTIGRLPADIAGLRHLIRDSEADLVKVHGPHNPQGALAARLEGVPVVWVVSSTRVPRGFRKVGGHLVKKLADSVLVTGSSIASAYPPLEACRSRTVAYFPPVDTAKFSPPPDQGEKARASLGIPAGARVVGAVANINPQKGIEYFVEAARLIGEADPRTYFVLVGAHADTQADYAARIQQQIAQSGLPDARFIVTGQRTDVELLYPAFDVKLLTSVPFSEGVPTTVLEAMSCGVPVVATDVGGVREVVEDGVTGFVVPAMQPATFASAARRVLDDDALAQRLAATARERATERFDTVSCADAHQHAYEIALANHGLRRPQDSREEREAA